MSQTYIVERKIEYWISRQIEDVFFSLGHDVDVFPQSMLEERLRPADFVFTSSTLLKVFGLQYKTLYHYNFTDDHWRVYFRQHGDLQSFDWIYYGFAELKTINERNIALHLCRFINPSYFKLSFGSGSKYMEINKSSVRNYRRWGGFYKGLLKCDVGKRIASEKKYREFLDVLNTDTLNAILFNNQIDIFFVDFTARRTVKFSTRIAAPENSANDNSEE